MSLSLPQQINRALKATARMIDRIEVDRMPCHLYGGYANDNALAARMTGDFKKDAILLQKKWEMDDIAYLAWAHSFAGTGAAMVAAGQKEVLRLMSSHDIPGTAAMTAAAVSAVNVMFAFIEQLPDTEAIFVLDEIARNTTETIQKMKTATGERP